MHRSERAVCSGTDSVYPTKLQLLADVHRDPEYLTAWG